MAKRKKKSPKMTRWATLPDRTQDSWIGLWIQASLVIRAFEVTGKIPKKVRFRDGDACMEKQPDGSGLIRYEATF